MPPPPNSWSANANCKPEVRNHVCNSDTGIPAWSSIGKTMTVAICTIEVSWLNLKIEAGVVFSTSHFFPVFHSNPVCFLSTELHILVSNPSPMIRRCICLRLECSTHTSHGNNLKNVPPCSYRYFSNFCPECPTFSGGNCDMRCLNLQLTEATSPLLPMGSIMIARSSEGCPLSLWKPQYTLGPSA